jgi:hypothetical protein
LLKRKWTRRPFHPCHYPRARRLIRLCTVIAFGRGRFSLLDYLSLRHGPAWSYARYSSYGRCYFEINRRVGQGSPYARLSLSLLSTKVIRPHFHTMNCSLGIGFVCVYATYRAKLFHSELTANQPEAAMALVATVRAGFTKYRGQFGRRFLHLYRLGWPRRSDSRTLFEDAFVSMHCVPKSLPNLSSTLRSMVTTGRPCREKSRIVKG